MLCCGYTLTDFPISIRLTSLARWQSDDCPSASKVTLMNMDKYFIWIHYERLHNHNKAKHNKTVCIFLGIYCTYTNDYIQKFYVDVDLSMAWFNTGLANLRVWEGHTRKMIVTRRLIHQQFHVSKCTMDRRWKLIDFSSCHFERSFLEAIFSVSFVHVNVTEFCS